MNNKDNYFDGDTNDLLLYKIAQRDKVIELCKKKLHMLISPNVAKGTTIKQVLIAHSAWAMEALAAIAQLKGEEKS